MTSDNPSIGLQNSLLSRVISNNSTAAYNMITLLCEKLNSPANRFIADLVEYSLLYDYAIFMESNLLTQTELIETGYTDDEGIHILYVDILLPEQLCMTYVHELTHYTMSILFSNIYSAPYASQEQKQAFLASKQQVVNSLYNTEYESYFIDMVNYYDPDVQDAEFIARYVEHLLDANDECRAYFQPIANYVDEYIYPDIIQASSSWYDLKNTIAEYYSIVS